MNEPAQTEDIAAAAEGMVGDVIPTAFFYLPMLGNTTASQHRYWTKFVVAVPDMHGNREQDVWQRYQQIECSGPVQPVLRSWDGFKSPSHIYSNGILLRVQTISADSHCGGPPRLPLPLAARMF